MPHVMLCSRVLKLENHAVENLKALKAIDVGIAPCYVSWYSVALTSFCENLVTMKI